MNREIKFRAWDKKNKVMIYPHNADEIIEQFEEKDYLYGPEEIYPWSDIDFLNGIYILHERYKDRLVVMQYTGLKDKNGKEIYEGDIVKTNYDVGTFIEIIFWHEYGAFRQIPVKEYYFYKEKNNLIGLWNFSKPVGTGDALVIGNIFENPDLLKQ